MGKGHFESAGPDVTDAKTWLGHFLWVRLLWLRRALLGAQTSACRTWGGVDWMSPPTTDIQLQFTLHTSHSHSSFFLERFNVTVTITCQCHVTTVLSIGHVMPCLLQENSGKKIVPDYCFASEAPGPAGLPQKRMLLLNGIPKVIFGDLLVRLSAPHYPRWLSVSDESWIRILFFWNIDQERDNKRGGTDWMTQKKIKPPSVTLYTGGFECQDRSHWLRLRLILTLTLWLFLLG